VDGAGVTALMDQLLAAEAGVAPERLRVMIDMRGLESLDAGGRSVVYRRSAENRSRIFAAVGSSVFHAFLFRFITFATRQRNARYFTDTEAGYAWLKTYRPTDESPRPRQRTLTS